MYQIISDSACDLTELYIKKHNIEIVPLTASLDGETYLKDKTEINIIFFLKQNRIRCHNVSLPSKCNKDNAFSVRKLICRFGFS